MSRIEPFIEEIAGFKTSHLEHLPSGAILIHSPEWLYPYKGFPLEEKVEAINVPKRIIVSSLSFIRFPPVVLGLLASCILPKSRKRLIAHLVEQFVALGELSLRRYYLPHGAYIPFCSKVGRLVREFMIQLDFPPHIFNRIGEIVTMIFEYDTAYRFRLMDILSEADFDELTIDPKRELKKLFKLYYQREELEYVVNKVRNMEVFIMFLLSFKRFRKAFVHIFNTTDTSELVYGADDTYHVLYRGNYKYLGQSYDDRNKMFVLISPKV